MKIIKDKKGRRVMSKLEMKLKDNPEIYCAVYSMNKITAPMKLEDAQEKERYGAIEIVEKITLKAIDTIGKIDFEEVKKLTNQ